MVSDILKNYKTVGCSMNLKIHFLGSHWTFFLKTLASSVINMENAFTKIFATWKSSNRAGAAQVCWMITVRPSRQTLHRQNTA
jgi:hypothetical protein